MPILKHAIKKMRVDKRRTEINKRVRSKVKSTVKTLRAKSTPEALSAVFASIDKAAKRHVMHRRKADRLKSRLSKAAAKTSAK
jgi:small subunit ribosomal protein S20